MANAVDWSGFTPLDAAPAALAQPAPAAVDWGSFELVNDGPVPSGDSPQAGAIRHLGGLWDVNAGAMVEAAGGLARFAGEAPQAGAEIAADALAPDVHASQAMRDARGSRNDAIARQFGVWAQQNGRPVPTRAVSSDAGPVPVSVAEVRREVEANAKLPPNAVTRFGIDLADQGKYQREQGAAESQVDRPESILSDPIQALKYYGNAAAGSAVPMAIAVAQPEIGLPMMGAQAFGGEYAERREQGRTVGESLQSAAVHGAAEVAFERISLGVMRGELGQAMTRAFGEKVAKSITDNIASRVVAGGAAEGATEVMTQAVQDLNDKYAMGDDISREQLLRNLKDAFFTGTALGGPMAGAHAALQKGADLLNGGTVPAPVNPNSAPPASPQVDIAPPDPAALAAAAAAQNPAPSADDLAEPAVLNRAVASQVAAALPEDPNGSASAVPAGGSAPAEVVPAVAEQPGSGAAAPEQGAAPDAAGAAAPAPASGAPNAAPARPRFDPDTRARAAADSKIQSLQTRLGLTPEQASAVRAEFDAPAERDRVTGLFRSEELDRTMRAALDAAEPGVYVEADLTNLGGLNAKLGTSGADPTLKEFADTIREELEKVADTVGVRKGGDEMGFITTGASQAKVNAAMMRARERFLASMAAQGHADVAHTKEGKDPGVGLHFGTSAFKAGMEIGDIVRAADTLVEKRKKGASYGNVGKAQAARPAGNAGSGTAAGAGPSGVGNAAAPAAATPGVAASEPGQGDSAGQAPAGAGGPAPVTPAADRYSEAVAAVRSTGRPTVSAIQSALGGIRYNDAAGFLDRMQQEGIVTAKDARGKRTLAQAEAPAEPAAAPAKKPTGKIGAKLLRPEAGAAPPKPPARRKAALPELLPDPTAEEWESTTPAERRTMAQERIAAAEKRRDAATKQLMGSGNYTSPELVESLDAIQRYQADLAESQEPAQKPQERAPAEKAQRPAEPAKRDDAPAPTAERADDDRPDPPLEIRHGNRGKRGAAAAPATEAPTEPARQRRAESSAGSDVATVQAAVDELAKTWRNAPPIEVYASPADAPGKLDSDAAGAYASGRVMLFANNLRDAEHAQFVILHETLGHHGLLGTLGPKLRPTMRTIYATNRNVRERAQQWMRENDSTDEALATEEALADMAAADLPKLSGWKRFVAAVKDALRRAGFTLKVSDNDVAALVERASKFVEDGGAAETSGAPKYSKAKKGESSNAEIRADESTAAGAGRLRQPGGIRGSAEPVALDGGTEQGGEGSRGPLEGLPRRVKVDGVRREFGPFEPAREAARKYAESAGIEYNPPSTYAPVDPVRARRIAGEFDAMAHDPTDPQAKASYDAMIEETLAQYRAILDTGLQVEFITGDDPYGNPRTAIIDVVENNHLWVFPTVDGFGGSASADVDISGNPLLAPTEFKISGRTALANDIFRVVHDYFGHVKEGVGFRADGEENAWRMHSAMYSPLARRAMTTETRGQNSWVNFGPHGEFNLTADGGETQYAPQKIGLLPEWVSQEGATDAAEPVKYSKVRRDQTETPEFKRWFGDSKVVDENGDPLVVYHGTTAEFYEFNNHKRGIFFTDDKHVSSRYGPHRQIAAYLSLKNPVVINLRGALWNELDSSDDASIAELRKTGQKIIHLDHIKNAAMMAGYDGAIIKNVIDAGGASNQYIAFRPEQIKSATGNTGAFDPANPDIRYSKAAAKSIGVSAPPANQPPGAFDGYTLPTESFRRAYAETQGNAFRKFVAGMRAGGRWLRRTLVDELHPLLTIERTVKDLGTYAGDLMNAYQRAELFHGRAGQRIRNFRRDYVRPLGEDIAKSKVTLDELSDFLYAQFAPRRNAIIDDLHKGQPSGAKLAGKGSGWTDAKAAKVLADFRAAGKYDELERFANRIYAMNAERINVLENAGLLSKETADEWRQEPKYVPLKDFADGREIAFPQKGGQGKGFSLGGRESQMAKGRTSEADNLVENTIAQVEMAYVRAEKNAVAQSLLSLVIANPNKDLWEVARIKTKPIRDPFTGEVLEDMYGNKVFSIETPSDRSPEIFNVKVDGKTYAIKFKGSSGEALATAMKNMGATQLGKFMTFLRTVSRYISLLRTSWNPEFVISNFARDVQTAFSNMSVEQSGKFARRMVKLTRASVSAAFRGETGLKSHPALGKYYDEFLLDGGRTDYANIRTTEEIAKDLGGIIRNTQRGKFNPIRVARKTWDYFEAANTAVENASRLAAYVTARESGMARKDAASLAKNLTVNFNRHGVAGPQINALWNFANASIQGSARYVKFLANNPKVALKRNLLPLFGLGFAISMLNGFTGGEDDDGEDRWAKVPDYERDRNLILMFGPHKIKLPMPYTYNLPFVVGSRIADVVGGRAKAKSVIGDVARATLNSANPLGEAPTAAGYIAPTLVDPFVEIDTNKNFFGGPIRPENSFDKVPDPDSQKAFENTPDPWRWLAEGLNSMTGGSAVRPGNIDVSPTTFDHLFKFALGGVGAFMGRMWNTTAGAAIKDELPEPNQVPFLRSVYGRVNDSQVRTDYYSFSQDAGYRIEEAELANKEGRSDEASDDQHKEWAAALDDLAPALKEAESDLRKLRKERKAAKAAGDEAAAKEVDKEIRSVQADFNRMYVDALRSIDEPIR